MSIEDKSSRLGFLDEEVNNQIITIVKCLQEVFVWGFGCCFCRVRVCRCRGCCSLSVCVCVCGLLIFHSMAIRSD